MEATQLTFLAMQAGSNLSHDVGYLDFGLTASLEEIVVVDEFISMNRRLLSGIEVDRDTLAVDAIAETGPGGHYMTSDHTYRYMREVQWRPTILNRYGRDKWAAGRQPGSGRAGAAKSPPSAGDPRGAGAPRRGGRPGRRADRGVRGRQWLAGTQPRDV